MSMDEVRTSGRRGESWRMFVAVPLPDAARELLEDIQSALRRHDWPVRWVDPQLAHITLKFLGDTDPGRTPAIRTALDAVAGNHAAIEEVTGRVGAFPSDSRPRVLWLGLRGDTAPLAELADDIDRSMAGLGFPSEERAFRPHITLGRLRRNGAPPGDFGPVASGLSVPSVDISFDRIQLVRSMLGRSGPTYLTLAEWTLGTHTGTAGMPVELVEHG